MAVLVKDKMSIDKLKELANIYQEDTALLYYAKTICKNIFNEDLSK